MNKKNKPAQSQFNKFTTNIFGDTYLPSINGKKFDEIAYSTYFDIDILPSTISDWQEIAKKADIIKYIEVDSVQTIKSFSAQEQIYPQYASIAQQIHDDINQLKWIHTGKFQRKILAYDSRSI